MDKTDIGSEILKISICMITYGHEKYIRQAIEGVLMQEIDFEIELVIANDASPDDTDAVIKEIISIHPRGKLIKYFKHVTNMGMISNFLFALKECKGVYVALCDGDDYWTDPSKLQKQVDFLEQNEDCSFCFHKAFKDIDEVFDENNFYPKNIYDIILDAKDFFKISTIPTASVLMRNIVKMPRTLLHSHPDFLMYCSLLTMGNAGYVNEIMSVYRVNVGVSSNYNSNKYLENRIRELHIERRYFGYSTSVKSQINTIYIKHIVHYLNSNRGKINFSIKIKYIKILILYNYFFKAPISHQLRLIKTLLN